MKVVHFPVTFMVQNCCRSIMAVSSWNDNGQKQFVEDPCESLETLPCLSNHSRIMFKLNIAFIWIKLRYYSHEHGKHKLCFGLVFYIVDLDISTSFLQVSVILVLVVSLILIRVWIPALFLYPETWQIYLSIISFGCSHSVHTVCCLISPFHLSEFLLFS